MKKNILTLIAFVAFGFSYAQEKESKNFGYSDGSSFITGAFKFEDKDSNSLLNMAITYNQFVTESVTYGISLGVNSNHLKASDYVLGVNLRKYQFAANRFSVFTQIGSTLSIPAVAGGADNDFNLSVSPGLSYFISNKIIMETSISLFNYRINKDLQDLYLNTNLVNLRVGFAYKF